MEIYNPDKMWTESFPIEKETELRRYLGKYIAGIRLSGIVNLRQSELAQRTGISQEELAHIEAGKKVLDNQIRKVAIALLGVDLSQGLDKIEDVEARDAYRNFLNTPINWSPSKRPSDKKFGDFIFGDLKLPDSSPISR